MGEQYPLNEFPAVNHGRWGVDELYKISKEFVDVEDFHGKSERGVKQEYYAHMLLINLARIFEAEADKQLPPPPSELHNRNNSGAHKNSYWKDFFGEIKNFKINFKNCLLVVGRSLEKLLCPVGDEDFGFLGNIFQECARRSAYRATRGRSEKSFVMHRIFLDKFGRKKK